MKLLQTVFFAMTALSQQASSSGGDYPYPFPNGAYPQPFELKLDSSFLDMTLRKVRDYRPTPGLSTEWTMEGPPDHKLREVAQYWGTSYDWKAIEKRINADFNHYATTVPGNGNYSESIPLHFVHHRSSNDDAVPLLLLHGWPSTFLEWSKVIKPLSDDPKHSFHIVAPDLPGFGFSPAPKMPGLGPREMGKAFDSLMHQLGYDKYGIITTDLGWFSGMWMVHDVEESIIGHFTDFFISPPRDEDRARLKNGKATAEEAAFIASNDAWFDSPHWTYATTHGQKPLALSQALADTPVGFLGWYWDINYATSDDYPYSNEELITDAMMLWIPGPYANIRAYSESFQVWTPLLEILMYKTDCKAALGDELPTK